MLSIPSVTKTDIVGEILMIKLIMHTRIEIKKWFCHSRSLLDIPYIKFNMGGGLKIL